ncbi:MAG: hypothetical protein ABIT38_11800, partial [Gemmatimonadaceae bacterium]
MHGFGMLLDDPSLVPSFAPGYRATMTKLRTGASTSFDANRDRLLKRMGENPNIASAQFLAFYFASWDDLKRGTDRFLRDRGDVREARNEDELRMYATLRTYFPTSEDRDWLQLFVSSLDDERGKFYRAYWLQQGQQRAAVRGRVEQLWNGTYQAAFGRFMRSSMQKDGYVLLSFPLGGEGRTIAVGRRDNFVAVPFPNSIEAANEAFYVAAHEVVGATANSAVRDNASAAEQRSGDAGKWQTLAAVRGGAMMLARIAPDLLDGYMRYYLKLARVPDVQGDPAARFAATFPLPDRIRDALQVEIDAVLGGI